MTEEAAQILGLREREYNALPGLRSSHVRTLADSTVAHYLHQLETWQDEQRCIDKKYDGKRVGALAHLAILEPDKMPDHAFIMPDYNGATKEGKPIHAQMKRFRDEPDYIPAIEVVAPQAEFDIAEEVSASVFRHPRAAALLDEGTAESTLTWKTGDFDCKARIDWMPRDVGPVIVDVKTSRKPVDPATFGRTCLDMRYHIQGAWYKRGVAAVHGEEAAFVIIAAETFPPYCVGVYRMTDDWIALGDAAIEHGLEKLREWGESPKDSAVPTYYHESVMNIPMPPWAKVKT